MIDFSFLLFLGNFLSSLGVCGRSWTSFFALFFLVRKKRPSWEKFLSPPPGWESFGFSLGWENRTDAFFPAARWLLLLAALRQPTVAIRVTDPLLENWNICAHCLHRIVARLTSLGPSTTTCYRVCLLRAWPNWIRKALPVGWVCLSF